MKFEVNDRLFDVRWKRSWNRRSNGTIRLADNGHGRVNTVCTISYAFPEKEKSERYELLSKAVSEQSRKDPYNKVVGRKVAFTKALQDFTREERKVFWDQYKEKCRIV